MTNLSADFIALAEQLAAFREAHGRLPVQCDAEDPHERRLGDFLRFNRRALALHDRGEREGTVRARVRHLDGVCPSWRRENIKPGRARVQNLRFSDRVRALAEFVNSTGRHPSPDADRYDERTLGKFLINVRQARQGRGTLAWDKAREAMLGREVPGWEAPKARSRNTVQELPTPIAIAA